MRIIAGTAGGRMLTPPKSQDIRPTSDRARETLFNIIGPWIEGAVLDLYSGTGALAIEALSRGASKAVLVDSSREAQQLIERNLATLGFAARGELMPITAERAVDRLEARGDSFTFIFADPPYAVRAQEWLIGRLATSSLLAPGGTVVMETAKREPTTDVAALPMVDERALGDTRLRLFRRP